MIFEIYVLGCELVIHILLFSLLSDTMPLLRMLEVELMRRNSILK